MKNKSLTRSIVSQKASFSAYRQDLRKDFRYSCAYCTTAENELHAKRFEIEHYLPQKHFEKLKNIFTNLLWACEECNKNKDDYYSGLYPGTKGKLIFRPDRFDFEEHFEVQEDLILGKTPNIGKFTEKFLVLNSKRLKTLRAIRRESKKLPLKIKFGIYSLEKLLKNPKKGMDKGLIFKQLNNLMVIGSTFDSAMDEIAKTTCAAYEQNQNSEKKEELADKNAYLKSEGITTKKIARSK